MVSVNEERAMHCSEHENRESHGVSGGIDEKTSMDDVRAPNVFERAKEEFQALSEVLLHKKKIPTSDIRLSSPHSLHTSFYREKQTNFGCRKGTLLMTNSDFYV